MKPMKFLFAFLLLSLAELSEAQYNIHGRIVDKETQEPLEGVSIFLSNTTKGTNSNKNGEFLLDNLKMGKYELVITSVNYEDYILPVQINEGAGTVSVKLTRKAAVLKEVIVEPYDKDGWDKWGDSFRSYLVGTSQLAKSCILRNPESVKFRYSSKSNRLRAFSDERLIFDNTDLGYRIIYLLKQFEIDFNSGTFSYRGYPVFEELPSKNKKEMARWSKLRSDYYRGSLRHFIRSLYFNRLSKDGFEIRKIIFITPEESHRVRNILKLRHEKDSMDYYLKVKNLPFNDSTVTLNDVIPRDSILTISPDRNSRSLFFNGCLQILFLNKKNPLEYANTLPGYRKNESIRSGISLRSDNPISIYPNGNYFDGLNLLIDGYWAWSEKISTMLPGDYTDSN
jgi:hypothetical protein